MSAVVTVVLPFFGLIALGYGLGRFLKIPAAGSAGLNAFLFYIALPVLYFRMVATTPGPTLANWSFFLTTTFATYCAFAIAFSFGALLNRGLIPVATIQGLIGSYANAAYLGPGLTLGVLGSAAAGPTALIFAFDHALLYAVVPLMMALGGTHRTDGIELARTIVRRIFLHPFIVAVLLGGLVAAAGTSLPGPVDGTLGFIASAAAPSALFALGLTLSQTPAGRLSPDLAPILLVRLVAHPVIVYLLLGWIGGFDRVWVCTAILMAALPPAANIYLIARRYRAFEPQAATAVILGTGLSAVTVTVLVSLIVLDALPMRPFY